MRRNIWKFEDISERSIEFLKEERIFSTKEVVYIKFDGFEMGFALNLLFFF